MAQTQQRKNATVYAGIIGLVVLGIFVLFVTSPVFTQNFFVMTIAKSEQATIQVESVKLPDGKASLVRYPNGMNVLNVQFQRTGTFTARFVGDLPQQNFQPKTYRLDQLSYTELKDEQSGILQKMTTGYLYVSVGKNCYTFLVPTPDDGKPGTKDTVNLTVCF